MISSTSETTLQYLRQAPGKPENYYLIDRRSGLKMLLLFLLVAFAVDLLTPLLVWKGILPSAVRWLSDLAVVGMLILALVQMLTFDQFPKTALLILGMSLIGITVALFEGQSIIATAWGWWLFFRYLIVGLFAYLQPRWPDGIARRLINLCVVILGLEVVIQLGQYGTGQIPGDSLAGSFGRGGHLQLIMFILFVLCIALGQWLTNGRWHLLISGLVLGGISSVLGEMKLFPFAIVALGLAALVIQILQGRQLQKFLIYLVLFGTIVVIFAGIYNTVVAEERGTRRLESYFDLQTLNQYLDHERYKGGGVYRLGRISALKLGWQNIQRDTTTFLFGMGLGARGESISLGIAGEGLQQGYYGLYSGTSLLVLMQEWGVVGLIIFGGTILWIIKALYKDIKLDPESDVTVLRYALILFSVGWPLWLWYTGIWNMGVTMMLYWATLGFVLGKSPPKSSTDLQTEDSIAKTLR